MDLFKQNMKGPTRPAPAVPSMGVSRYSPVTNWNDDPFGADVFEPTPSYAQKKKPPPRPPPPKVSKHPDIPTKPSHFIRKPTVLSSILGRHNKNKVIQQNASQPILDVNSDVDTHKMFPKCDRANVQMGTLIDLSSPPSSPTFTTRSSSDGVSVDSFGSDATTSTNHQNAFGGNASQAESGFEDDFDLFLNSRKPLHKDDTIDDFANVDPFSPLPSKTVTKKTVFSSESYETSSITSSQYSVPPLKGPTIIRAKPARPKPPDNSALLKSTFGSDFHLTSMNVNTTTPITKISNGFNNFVETKPDITFNCTWDSSPERDSSPPMPTIPPPPPPVITDEDLPVVWPEDLNDDDDDEDDEPYAIALFDYHTGHREDLSFTVDTRITLIRRENDEWMYGRLQNGSEGLFPTNYVEVKVPLPNEQPNSIGTAIALYDFEQMQSGDLNFSVGDKITVLSKINDEWHYGECNGAKGQFPANYVKMS